MTYPQLVSVFMVAVTFACNVFYMPTVWPASYVVGRIEQRLGFRESASNDIYASLRDLCHDAVDTMSWPRSGDL